jgi:hypothetical protein
VVILAACGCVCGCEEMFPVDREEADRAQRAGEILLCVECIADGGVL